MLSVLAYADGKITAEQLLGETLEDCECVVIDAEQSDDGSSGAAHPQAGLPPPG